MNFAEEELTGGAFRKNSPDENPAEAAHRVSDDHGIPAGKLFRGMLHP
jgi:hypothetical protein